MTNERYEAWMATDNNVRVAEKFKKLKVKFAKKFERNKK